MGSEYKEFLGLLFRNDPFFADSPTQPDNVAYFC